VKINSNTPILIACLLLSGSTWAQDADPQVKTVAARATYKAGENALPPIGIPNVVVGGTLVVKDSVVQNVQAGQPIRFPVEDKGRFEPVSVNGWYSHHTTNIPVLEAKKYDGRTRYAQRGSEVDEDVSQ